MPQSKTVQQGHARAEQNWGYGLSRVDWVKYLGICDLTKVVQDGVHRPEMPAPHKSPGERVLRPDRVLDIYSLDSELLCVVPPIKFSKPLASSHQLTVVAWARLGSPYRVVRIK